MYLGIDLGTSGVKVLLIDENQSVVGSKHAPLEVSRPHPGWSEQRAQDWIDATREALRLLKRTHRKELAAVKGIGLSGQMHGATLLDKSDNVLRPCMLWNDVRSHREAARLDKNPLFRQISGNIVFAGFTAPKLEWVKNNEAEIFKKTTKVLLPKDYLRWWMCGEYATDPSDASGTSWFDVKLRNWSRDLLDECQMDLAQMPSICEGVSVSGVLASKLANEWGMGDNVVIAGGGGDNAASAIGMGIVEQGQSFLSLGTSGVLFAANDAYLPNPDSAVHAFCHALPQRWHQMGVILSATDALNWFAAIAQSSADELSRRLGDDLKPPLNTSGQKSGQLTFLPYLSGERTPHNDASIRGVFSGLGHANNQSDLTQAIMEGVGFAFRDCLEALALAGTTIKRVTALGGGANSTYWLKAISTILNIPIDVPIDGDFGAAFGAARMGLIAAESCDPSTICVQPIIGETILPQKEYRQAFDEAYEFYTRLYPAMKGLEE